MKYIVNRDELLKIFPKKMICAEIGVLAGDFSKKIKQVMDPQELYLIDHFSGKLMSGDHNGLNVKEYDLDSEYENLNTFFKDDSNVFLKKGFSYDVLKQFPDNYFDFFYLDSDHTYEGTFKELELCLQKIKPGGYITGHDYSQEYFPDCKKAIDEFCTLYQQEISWVTIEDRMASFVIQVTKKHSDMGYILADAILHSGFSMLSVHGIYNLKEQIDYIIQNNISGDFVETGIAKGGSIIFMKKYLDILDQERVIHACDSFQGMPPAESIDLDYTGDHPDNQDHSVVNVSRNTFIKNLKYFHINENDIVIHEGWFKDTLSSIISPIALLRMDGDWYESTMTTFEKLYDKVVNQGIVLIDDYGWWQGCKKATHDFFRKRGIPETVLHYTDNTEVWFQKKDYYNSHVFTIKKKKHFLFQTLKDTPHLIFVWIKRLFWAINNPFKFIKKYFL